MVGVVFVLLQVLAPLHQALGANLGSRTAAWLYDRLTEACVRPPGMGHLEDPKLSGDLTMARDFDLGITGPPMHISMDFIADGLVQMIAGLASALRAVRVRLVGAARARGRLARDALAAARERRVAATATRDEVREAQRHADYAYRLAVDPPAAKELRLFGLADWVVERFVAPPQRLFELQ